MFFLALGCTVLSLEHSLRSNTSLIHLTSLLFSTLAVAISLFDFGRISHGQQKRILALPIYSFAGVHYLYWAESPGAYGAGALAVANIFLNSLFLPLFGVSCLAYLAYHLPPGLHISIPHVLRMLQALRPRLVAARRLPSITLRYLSRLAISGAILFLGLAIIVLPSALTHSSIGDALRYRTVFVCKGPPASQLSLDCEPQRQKDPHVGSYIFAAHIVAIWLGGSLVLLARRLRAHSGASAWRECGIGSTIFLCSFKDDTPASDTGALLTFVDYSFETRLNSHFCKFGSFLAVGAPGRLLPTLGAAKMELNQDTWQSEVLKLMAHAKTIVIMAGETKGVHWELNEVFRNNWHKKLLLASGEPAEIMAGRRRKEMRKRFDSIKASAAGMAVFDGLSSIANAHEIKLICSDVNGHPIFVFSRHYDRDTCHLAVIVGHFLQIRESSRGPLT